MIVIEVRSTGPGPRATFCAPVHRRFWRMALIASGVIGKRWTRMATDHRGRYRRCADGIAIIIQEQRHP